MGKRTKFEAGANDRARHPVKTLAINALRQNTSALENQVCWAEMF
jgi:hypothetical protein